MITPFDRTTEVAAPADEHAAFFSPVFDQPEQSAPDAGKRKRMGRLNRHRWPLVAGTAAMAVMMGTGAGAYSVAHKTITLDVDGKISTVPTFAGSVGGLLEDQGIAVGEHDTVVPAVNTPLKGDRDVVVRVGREVTVESGGQQSKTWLTALDAEEALDDLAARGGSDARLVASRSGQRASLALRLDANGPVNVVADGQTRVAPDGSKGIDVILDQTGVVLGELDLVSVQRNPEAEPAVSLVVQRVKVEEVPTTAAVPFETETQEDAGRYADLAPVIKQAGVEGVHTTVNKITTVDGVEQSRELVSESVTTPPVNQIVVKGTNERPKATPKASATPKATSTPKASASPKASATPKASSTPKASADSGSGSSESASAGNSTEQTPAPAETQQPAASSDSGASVSGAWAALAKCESGGNPRAVSSNGLYHGLYQFSVQTWRAMGGSGLPSQASVEEQTMRAQMLQQRSGWGQWPACSRKIGLR